MRPVYKDTTMDKFDRIPVAAMYKEGTCKWAHKFHSEEIVSFAFIHPYTCRDLDERLSHIEAQDEKGYTFIRQVLTTSLKGHPVELVTITSSPNEPAQDPMCLSDGTRKPVVFVSARVHPGEVPAQWCLEGLLNFATIKDDPRAIAFREKFVLVMVPILNPDGVAMGHYRSDSLGQNLNRYYDHPQSDVHPTIHAVKKYLHELNDAGVLHSYVDLHAHANKRGCFIYGNSCDDDEVQSEVLLLPKLMALNTPHFDFSACNFTEKNMTKVEKRDGLSKEASGRVICYREMGLVRSYTLECNYCDGPVVNEIFDAMTDDPRASPGRLPPKRAQKYGPPEWMDVGRSIGIGLLDLEGINPWSRLPNSEFENMEGLRQWAIGKCTAVRDPGTVLAQNREEQWSLCA